jgi:glycosyltransferase involved in cell wall biosynthesis
MALCVLIPAYNESQEIGQVIEAIKAKGFDVIVVDDGSTDNCGAIAKEKGAVVLRNHHRCGKGLSLREGFKHVLKGPYAGVITMDADGQHDPADLDRFLAKQEQDPVSVITGNRMVNSQNMPRLRYWTNRLMSFLISSICKQHIPDTQCGYRYIHRQVLEQLKITCNDFEIETEVLVKASKKGYKIHSVPVKTIYRDEKSKIRPFKDTIRFFVYLIRELMCRPNP